MIPGFPQHYRVESELGRGGMGVVYRAYDERLLRPVAIKVLKEEVAIDPRRRLRILEEARAACALSHPAITTVYDVGETDAGLFIVMELVAGHTLRSIMSSAVVEPRVLLGIAVQIAEALAAAHDQGIVHGDVKPENVVVRTDGRVKLLDFGVARRTAVESKALTIDSASAAASIAATLGPSGTLPYMAPELLIGAGGDSRTDLYALGVLLYEGIAGRRPFAHPEPLALVNQILNHPVPPLDLVAPVSVQGLSSAVHKLLEREPARRTQTAREAAADLNAILRSLELGAMLPASMAGKRSVAVLPFRLLTPDASDAYLGGALADAIITALSEGGTLLVRPANSIMRYASHAIDALVAGRELNVNVVVDGSIQRVDRRLRVHVQARDVLDGAVLSSTRHEADTSDLFKLQDAVADGLRRALGVNDGIGQEKPARPPTTNAKAYELFMRSSERLLLVNRWDTRSAIDMLEDATRIDPTFADAWARLAEARVLMQQSFDPGGRWMVPAQQAIRRAVALNPDSALVHSARARTLWTQVTGFKAAPALRSTQRALELNRGCHPAWTWQGLIFYHIGLQTDARAALTASLAVNPNDSFTLSFLAQTFFEERDFDRAIDFTERALAIDRSGLYANLFRPMAFLYRGDLAEADHAIRDARSAIGADPMLFAYDALLHAKDSRPARATAAIKKALIGRSLVHGHHTFHLVAAARALLGDQHRSLVALRKAARTGFPNYAGFRDDPHFESLHHYAPFLKLMTSLKRECATYRREFSAGDSPV